LGAISICAACPYFFLIDAKVTEKKNKKYERNTKKKEEKDEKNSEKPII